MAVLNPNRLAGTIEFRIAGTAYATAGEFSYRPTGVVRRESQMSESGFSAGYTEEMLPGFIEGELFDASTLNTAALAGLDGVQVFLKLGNGKIVSGENLFYAGELTVNAKTGRLPVRFEAGPIGFIVEVPGVSA